MQIPSAKKEYLHAIALEERTKRRTNAARVIYMPLGASTWKSSTKSVARAAVSGRKRRNNTLKSRDLIYSPAPHAPPIYVFPFNEPTRRANLISRRAAAKERIFSPLELHRPETCARLCAFRDDPLADCDFKTMRPRAALPRALF